MRILLLANDYPPLNSVGAKRPAAWKKYLEKHGHYVIVVTGTPCNENQSDINVIRTDVTLNTNFFIRKLISLNELYLAYILFRSSRLISIYYAADNLLKLEKFDFIIATAEPFILFRFAALLSKKHTIPWVADYRDPWSNIEDNAQSNLLKKWRLRYYYRIFERIWTSSAALITTAAESYKEKIYRITKHPNIATILNGHEINEELINEPNRKVFRIAYSGRLYGHQPIEIFLDAFKNFVAKITNPSHIEIHFYGLADWPEQVERIKSYDSNLITFFRFHRNQNYDTYISEMSRSHILLLLSQKNKYWLNAKIFDYLPLAGHIILYPKDDGELEKIIKDSGKGKIVDDIHAFQKEIEIQYALFNTNPVLYNSYYKGYSREESTLELISQLKSLGECVE